MNLCGNCFHCKENCIYSEPCCNCYYEIDDSGKRIKPGFKLKVVSDRNNENREAQ